MSACVPTRADEPRREKRIHEPHSPPPIRPRRPRLAGADVSASIAVFLIALPLSLGIALATGAPLQAGLVAAAVGGIVAGRLGGAPLQVSGPAAGLTVVTAELIQHYGWRTTCAITILAGLAQLGLGLLRVARTALAVSPAIVHGMLAGIGVTIAVAQLHIVLGGIPHSSVLDNLRELPAQLAGVRPAALSVSVLTLALLVVWPRLPGRVGRLLRKVPTPLVAVAVATTTASLAGLHLPKVDLPSWSSHALATLPEGPVLGLVAAVLTITLVCSVQSLLGAVAVDKLVAGRPEQSARVGRSDLDRELLGQGAANVVSGALGGLPIAGVAVRSSANVQAGAVSRNSTMLHGVLVVVATLLMVPILELIPLASLAALVMAVGIQMVSLHHIRTVTRHREVLVYAVTTLGVVFLGVLEGVALGIAMAVGVALHRLTRTRITHDESEGVHHVRVRGQLTFLAVPRLSRALHLVPQGAHSVVELDGSFMDHAAYESLQDWQNTQRAHGGTVELIGRRAGVRIGEPTGAAGLHADVGMAELESADCRCHPWTPWRNHQCEIPEASPPREGQHGETRTPTTTRAPGTSDTDGPGTPTATAAHTASATPLSGTGGLDTPARAGQTGKPGETDGPIDAGRPDRGHPRQQDGPGTSTGGPDTDTTTSAKSGAATGPSTGSSTEPSTVPSTGGPGSGTGTGPATATATATGPDTGTGTGPTPGTTTNAGTSGATDGSRPSARQLARGISAFQRNTAPLVRGELARLAREGQQPSQLFLTCADSRVVTSMITSSGPGDLFVVRNVGNLVPLPGQESRDDSVAAAIEYAVDVLQVRSITVCGHSGCGAMQALLAAEPDGPQTPLRRWLRHGLPSVERMSDESRPWARLAGRAPADAVEQLCLTNVVQQLQHLRAHASVDRALRAGALELHGMYFHVGEAQAYLLAEGTTDEVFDHVGVADLSA